MGMRWRFGLTLAGMFAFILYIVGTGFFVAWYNLDEEKRAFLLSVLAEQANIFVLFATFLLFGLGGILYRLFLIYSDTARLKEEIRLISTANPRHRVTQPRLREIRELAATVNTFADRYEELQGNVASQVREASAAIEREKDFLAALMSELSQGVVVCNIEGQILLYNDQAHQLLTPMADPQLNGSARGLLGLGRSIFGIFDRNLIVHTLDTVSQRLEQGHASPVAQLVTTTPQGRFLRLHIAPVQDREREITGFVLTLEDATQQIESSSRKDVILQTMIEQTRASLANIRAAIETLIEYPDMERARVSRFTTIIRDEALALSTKIDTISRDETEQLRMRWPLEEMIGGDLVNLLRRKTEQHLGVHTADAQVDDTIWLKVDSYPLVQALTYVLGRCCEHRPLTCVDFSLQPMGRFAQLDLSWHGAVDSELLHTWQQQPAIGHGEGIPLTLQEVMERHEGEVWCQVDRESERTSLRLLLPSVAREPAWQAPMARNSRPVFYDFDLFSQAGQKPEQDERLLTELVYTIFDTETTGLSPSDGDEIISIGAVRIVNGRLLRHETFEQLIDPRRPLSEESIRIHGIQPHILKGQPVIEQVLPRFARFAEDTVLVAHNAAFDMRFLQIKEGQTGVRFTQPVLDTLLLSAVVQENQASHSLESIANALGINIIGRHTALGDAIVTGEVFLKLLKLLEASGIRTLGEARAAAQRSVYARLQY